MNAGDKANHKEKVKSAILEFIKTLPNQDRQTVMANLKPMWVKLEELNLVVEDMNFQAFQQQAQQAFTMAEVSDIMGI